jgi:hypothetical protein
MTSCGYTPAEIDEMTLHDVVGLFAYWRYSPPVHDILKCVYRIEHKPEWSNTNTDTDPSGIGGLIARFPNGFQSPGENGGDLQHPLAGDRDSMPREASKSDFYGNDELK